MVWTRTREKTRERTKEQSALVVEKIILMYTVPQLKKYLEIILDKRKVAINLATFSFYLI